MSLKARESKPGFEMKSTGAEAFVRDSMTQIFHLVTLKRMVYLFIRLLQIFALDFIRRKLCEELFRIGRMPLAISFAVSWVILPETASSSFFVSN